MLDFLRKTLLFVCRRAMNGDDDGSYKVELYIYDMSKGLAKQMSPALLGKGN